MNVNQQNDLRLFIKLFGGIDEPWCIFADETEIKSPDLLINLHGTIIGVEHTRVYWEDPDIPSTSAAQPYPQEKFQWRIVKRAREIFRLSSDQLLVLYVSFKEPSSYRAGNDIEREAHALAQSILAALSRFPASDPDHPVVFIQAWQMQQLGLPFPRGVESYNYSLVRTANQEFWSSAGAYMVPDLTVQRIEKVICGKEARLDSYRQRCERIWLLLATDSGLPSSNFDVPSVLIHHRFTTRFDQLFLLELFPRRLTKIHVRQQV
jgi:hypothetical protein